MPSLKILAQSTDPTGPDTPPKTPAKIPGIDTSAATAYQTEKTPDMAESKGLPDGIYVPMLTFFDPITEDVDTVSVQKQAVRLQQAGVAGLLLHGSNGEAAHLSRSERVENIKAVVDAIRTNRSDTKVAVPFPILAGCGAQSVRETVELCCDAADAGATHALVLPPGYYASLLSRDQVHAFFCAVADVSPIPVLIYNFPPAANGVDLDSDAIIELARHPNIAGVKLTCGNTGKLARVVSGTATVRGSSAEPFFVAGGSADFILQGAVVGANGSIAGLANLAPRACVEILTQFRKGRLDDARDLQYTVAEGDWLAIRYGFVGVKHGMQRFAGFGVASEGSCVPSPVPRKPCQMLSDKAKAEFDAGTDHLLHVEQRLEAKVSF